MYKDPYPLLSFFSVLICNMHTLVFIADTMNVMHEYQTEVEKHLLLKYMLFSCRDEENGFSLLVAIPSQSDITHQRDGHRPF